MVTDPEVPGMPDLVLRPATTDDVEQITELYLATRRAAEPAMPPQIHTRESLLAYLTRDVLGKEVWVAERDDVLAFAVLAEAFLDALYVGPDHQGFGIGTALLDLAKARRPDGFALWVFASNAPARGFYHRHGLVELEHTDGSANEERSPDVRMAWPGKDPVAFLRRQIDEVDDELALVLARRFALTATVQGYKRQPGREGRDPDREREIAERMAAHAPGLGADQIGRIMDAVIDASLDAYEQTAETRER
ncbi:MAG TPA: GNAT family N-acetyltransferase [Marmoricola sp.]|jgi:chorismate mutase/GNAT superfamily N-acetyltransferase|nr:GNAT family N-acetyltransferase [Marmoricola sp.]